MRYARNILLTYICVLHILIVVMFLKFNFVEKLKLSFVGPNLPDLSSFYNETIIYHKYMDGHIPPGATIFIGDSITQSLVTSAITNLSVNYGIGSDTTLGVLKRIEMYQSINRAKGVVIAVGINDLPLRDNVDIISNYEKILHFLPKELPIVVSAILPVDESITSLDLMNSRISELNQSLSDLASKYRNVEFLNAGSFLQGSDLNLKSEFHVGDGIHLNSLGYNLWIEQLRITLDNLFSSDLKHPNHSNFCNLSMEIN